MTATEPPTASSAMYRGMSASSWILPRVPLPSAWTMTVSTKLATKLDKVNSHTPTLTHSHTHSRLPIRPLRFRHGFGTIRGQMVRRGKRPLALERSHTTGRRSEPIRLLRQRPGELCRSVGAVRRGWRLPGWMVESYELASRALYRRSKSL